MAECCVVAVRAVLGSAELLARLPSWLVAVATIFDSTPPGEITHNIMLIVHAFCSILTQGKFFWLSCFQQNL